MLTLLLLLAIFVPSVGVAVWVIAIEIRGRRREERLVKSAMKHVDDEYRKLCRKD